MNSTTFQPFILFALLLAFPGCKNANDEPHLSDPGAVPVASFEVLSNEAGTVSWLNTSTNATDYVWGFGDGNSSTESNPSHTYSNSGTFSVVLIASNSVGADTATQMVQVNQNTGLGSSWKLANATPGFDPRIGHASVAFDNRLWVIGGTVGWNDIRNDVWYSFNGVDWFEATSNADFSPRTNHTALVYDNQIWVIGGSLASPDVWSSSNGIDWTRAGALPQGISGKHSSYVYKDKMYIVGAFGKTYSSFDGLTWTQVGQAPWGNGRTGFAAAAIDTLSVITGGYGLTNSTYFDDVWISLDSGNTWNLVSTDLTARAEHALLVYEDQFWLSAGGVADVWNSEDGKHWSRVTDAAEFGWLDGHTTVAFDDRLWTIGGYNKNGSYTTSAVWYTE